MERTIIYLIKIKSLIGNNITPACYCARHTCIKNMKIQEQNYFKVSYRTEIENNDGQRLISHSPDKSGECLNLRIIEWFVLEKILKTI